MLYLLNDLTKKLPMNTIYNLLHTTETVETGVIEIFNMYDYNHYLIVLDGKHLDCIENSNYEEYLLERKILKKILKKSEVEPSDLLFVFYEFELFARKVVDYDMNNYGYAEMYDLVEKNLLTQLKYKVLYHGLTL
jgi:hypothetical protein